MKRYIIDLVKRIEVTVEAETASDAVLIARTRLKLQGMGDGFDINEIADAETQDVLMTCEVCSGDILPGENYTTAEDDNYSVCEKCSKEAKETNG